MKTIKELLADAKALSIQVDGEKYGMVKFTVGIAELEHNEGYSYEYSIYSTARGMVSALTLDEVFLNFKIRLGLEVPQVEEEIII